MKATETKIETFMSANKTQFVIPIYQRNYDWTVSECKQLLDDILEVGTDKKITTHFIGSIVFVHDDVYTASKIKELSIIDGQQRLTTLTLIYLVIYRIARDTKNESLADEINETYLINKFATEEEKLKFRPTENHSRALKYLLRGDENEEFPGFSRLFDNFDYLKRQISEENFEIVRDGLSKLIFVEVSLERQKDSPQRIFESLNSTGLNLSQADLIRNYILMGLNRRDQERIYRNYWEIIENSAKDEVTNESRVSDYVRDYLTLVYKKVSTRDKVYNEFKSRYPTTLTIKELEEELKEIKNLVKYYNKLINPKNEADSDIRTELIYINRLKINAAYPFLMKVYDDYASKNIDKPAFIEVLRLVQSFVWRRFILGLPTSVLNQIFMALYDKIAPENYLPSIQKILTSKSGAHRFPQDQEVLDSLKSKDIYSFQPKNRFYFFEKLENYNNKEIVVINGNNDITIATYLSSKT